MLSKLNYYKNGMFAPTSNSVADLQRFLVLRKHMLLAPRVEHVNLPQ